MKILNILTISTVLIAQVSFAQTSKLVQCSGKDISGNALSVSMSVSEKTLTNGKLGYDASVSISGKMGGKSISIKNAIIKDKTKTNYFDVVGYALLLNPTKSSILTVAAFTKDASASLVGQDGSESELKLTCSGI